MTVDEALEILAKALNHVSRPDLQNAGFDALDVVTEELQTLREMPGSN